MYYTTQLCNVSRSRAKRALQNNTKEEEKCPDFFGTLKYTYITLLRDLSLSFSCALSHSLDVRVYTCVPPHFGRRPRRWDRLHFHLVLSLSESVGVLKEEGTVWHANRGLCCCSPPPPRMHFYFASPVQEWIAWWCGYGETPK